MVRFWVVHCSSGLRPGARIDFLFAKKGRSTLRRAQIPPPQFGLGTGQACPVLVREGLRVTTIDVLMRHKSFDSTRTQ
jgi:hypothetical protein